MSSSDGGPGPAGTWAPRSVQPWLPPLARATVDGSARVEWLDDLRVTLCDGYARGVDRPPRG